MYGWSRDEEGRVSNYHPVAVCNTITLSTSTSGTQRPIVAVVYD